ncbi:MAG: GNAT family N-acetyltransferase [Flaviflexus sp.]|uniref:GNAT family N-acetyltransferase n=1 Tax=Flaviflexus sp. TaxID=1969482 RepID=UPI003F90FAA1
MGSLGIRAATVLDADRLAFVHGQCWKESHRALLPDELIESKEEKMKGIYPKELADPGATSYWVATWGGEIIGFAGATALGTGQERPLELTSLYVIADYQGRGIGEKLLNYAIGEAPALLWVIDGSAASAFYRSQGFAFDGTSEIRDDLAGAIVQRMIR